MVEQDTYYSIIPPFSSHFQQAIYPHRIRVGDEIVILEGPTDGFARKLEFFSDQIHETRADWDSREEKRLRGFLMEFVAYPLLDALTYVSTPEDYRVVPAHPLLDASREGVDKGADLLFARINDDQTKEVCILFDATCREKTDKELGPGVNTKLGYAIPVVIVDFDRMVWTGNNGKHYETKQYIHHVVRRALAAGSFNDPFCGLSEEEFPHILDEIRRRIVKGCQQTRRVIIGGNLDPEVKGDVLQRLQRAESILGISE